MLRGEGWAEVDGQRHAGRPETKLLIGRAAWHTVHNTGSGQMSLSWMIAAAGVEVSRARPSAWVTRV